MKTNFLFLCILFILSFTSLDSQAADRAQIVQSKIHSALSSVLPKTDFLIIVNKADQLDDGGSVESVAGSIKMLPGLNVGVDSKGSIISQNQNGGNYQGAVSVNVIIDDNVNSETYQTIQKILPDLMGGVRDDDEIKLSKSILRQKAVDASASAPAIHIQNQMPENKTSMQDQIKFLSLFLVFGGLLFWMVSKMIGQNSSPYSKNSAPDLKQSSLTDKNTNPHQPPQLPSEKIDFSMLDAEAVGLFLMKQFKDKKEISIFSRWVEVSSGTHQREVFKQLPAWILDFFHDQDQMTKDEKPQTQQISVNDLFYKISLIEQSLKSTTQKQKAFLMWFPAEALRFVPSQTQASLSQNSKRVLWNIRPDLGNFVKMDVIDIDSLMVDLSQQEITNCLNEIKSWSSKTVEQDSNQNNSGHQILRWKGYIDGLNEFSPIDSQLEQAKEKMSEEQYQTIYKNVAHLNSPLFFTASERKDWLRTILPDDYFWWQTLLNKNVDWDLKSELRPLRYNMFLQASQAKNYELWSEKEKKISSQRILNGFRAHIKNEMNLIQDAS